MAVNIIRYFLICLASAFAAVETLECLTKGTTVCKPRGPICETLKGQLVVQEEAKLNCSQNQNVCVSISAQSTDQGFTVDTDVAGCLASSESYGVGCYDGIESLRNIDYNMAKHLADAETHLGIEYGAIKICLCEGNLCNKATKAALSGTRSSCFNLSIIITSVLITFVVLRMRM